MSRHIPLGSDSAAPPHPSTPLPLPLLATPSLAPGSPLDSTPSNSASERIENKTIIEPYLPAATELSAAHDNDTETSITIEGELTMAECTLVEDTLRGTRERMLRLSGSCDTSKAHRRAACHSSLAGMRGRHQRRRPALATWCSVRWTTMRIAAHD